MKMHSEEQNDMETENAANDENVTSVANTKKPDQTLAAPINGANGVRVRNVMEINGSLNETNNNVVNGENKNKRTYETPASEVAGEKIEKQRKLENGIQIKAEPPDEKAQKQKTLENGIQLKVEPTVKDEDVNGAATSTAENKTIKIETSTSNSAGIVTNDAEASCSTASSSHNSLPKKAAVKVEKADASSTTRETCRYGLRCYRLNPAHRAEEAHPGDYDYRRPTYPSPPPGTPACPYDRMCFRRNPVHFQEYSHPPEDTNFARNYNKFRQSENRRQQQQLQGISSSYLDNDSDFEEDPFFDASFDEPDYVPSEDNDNDESDEYLGDYDDCDRAEE